MRVETKEIYKFEELTPEVQQKVVDNNRDWNVDYNWWEFAYDEIEEYWSLYGIRIVRNKRSGMYFNLDRGSYFYADDVYVEDYGKLRRALGICKRSLEGQILDGNVRFGIRHFGGGDAKTTVEVVWSGDIRDDDGKISEKLEDQITELVDNLCSQALSDLQREYDYLTSDEAIRESIISNESEFDWEGNPA